MDSPKLTEKERRASTILRGTERGLTWVYYMKLNKYCAMKWVRLAQKHYVGRVKSFKSRCTTRLVTAYWTKLFYNRLLNKGNKLSVGTKNFKLRVAADVFGLKRNVKMTFEETPDLQTIINTIESVYDPIARSARPLHFPDIPFKVHILQIFDKHIDRWVELVNPQEQLIHDAQLFCFTPESSLHSDSQGIIPAADEIFTWKTCDESPCRNRSPDITASYVAPAGSDKARFVFYEMCRVGSDSLTLPDLQAGFKKCDMIFGQVAVQLFNTIDANHDGVLTLVEWIKFATASPNVIDALYFRIKDLYSNPKTASIQGHSHLASLSRYNDPTAASHSITAPEKLHLAREYQVCVFMFKIPVAHKQKRSVRII